MATNFAKAVASHVADGMEKVTKFLSILTRHQVNDSVYILIGNQRDILPCLRGDFGLVFYDADHTGDSTTFALNWIIEHAPQATIAVYDYCDVYEHYRCEARH
jgi:hypothetical protein